MTETRTPEGLDRDSRRYQVMIGTGGIGSGVFFALDGNHTLGREESRGGRFLDKRDYCKLHIISHYVKVLLGSGFRTILVGKVGDDEVGHRLVDEMQHTPLDVQYVTVVPGAQTLFSTCFIYPDGSGGNLTTADSASAQVTEADIEEVSQVFHQYQNKGVALAAPEVPLKARRRLLELGSRYGFWRAASLNSAEMQTPEAIPILKNTDLLGVNLDEAAALVGNDLRTAFPERIFEAAAAKVLEIQPAISLAVTAGKHGSWLWSGGHRSHVPAMDVTVSSTAGAGDAFLAGLIVAKVAGLEMDAAQHLATLVAGFSVTSAHTIHPGLNRKTLLAFVQKHAIPLPDAVMELLGSADFDG